MGSFKPSTAVKFSTESNRLIDFAVWASLVGVLFLVLGRGGKWGFADHGAKALLFGSAFLALRGRSPVDLLRHPASAGAVGLGVWFAAAGLFSPAPMAAWSAVSGLWILISLAGVGLAVWREPHRRFLERLLALVVCSQSSLLLFGRWSGREPFLLFPGNPQYASFWSCAVFFLALSHALAPGVERSEPTIQSAESRTRWIWAGVCLFSILGVWFQNVRAGLLGVVVGIPVFGFARFGRRGLLAAGLLLILGFALLPASYVGGRLKFSDPRGFKRADIWASALSGVLERPLFGWGPGQFENLYERHGRPQETEPVRYELSTSFAHNEFLQVFAESGLLGGLFALLALAGLFISAPRGPRGPGVLAAWAGTAVFAAVNLPLALPACGVLAGVLAALAPPGRWAGRPLLPVEGRRWGVFLALSLAAVFGVGETLLAANELFGSSGVAWLDSTDPRRVEGRRERADRWLHFGTPEEQGRVEGELRALLHWSPHRADLWRDLAHLESDHRSPPAGDEAVAAYRQALSLKPYHAPWWVELAQVMELRGDALAARRSLREALRAEPRYFDAAVAYGNLLRAEGRPAEALRWLEILGRRSAFWPRADPGDSGYRRAVLHREAASLDAAMALCLMDLKRYSDALQTLSRLDPTSPDRLSLEAGCLFFQGRSKAAEEKLISGRRLYPNDPRWETLLKRLRRKPGARL